MNRDRAAEVERHAGMNRWFDLAGSLVLAAAGLAVALYAATRPPPSLVYDAIGPMGFPLVLGSLLFGLGILQSVRTLIQIRATGPIGASEGTEDEPGHPSSTPRALGFIAGAFVYIAALEPVGFLIVTPLAMTAALAAMRYRSWPARVLAAAAFTVLGFVVFVQVLSVPLPMGVLADALISLGLIDYR